MIQTNKIIHYDTINSIKNNNSINSFDCNFILKEKLMNVKKIILKSIELPIGMNNVRIPYNHIKIQMIVNGITSIKTITMPNKSYIDIYLFLTDLNNLLKDNIILNIDESAPQFSFSSEMNKLIIKGIYSSSTVTFYNEGLLYYYLGHIDSSIIPTKTLLSGSLFVNTYTLLYSYNLSFDIYLNMHISNLISDCPNNNGNPCSFKICIDAITNTINYSGENNSYVQFITLSSNIHLTNLTVVFFDRYNNKVDNNYDYSFSLEYEF